WGSLLWPLFGPYCTFNLRSAAGVLTRTLFWIVAGLVFFASVPFAAFSLASQYRSQEPFYVSPLERSKTALYLRSDSFGKGFFGASRNGGRRHKGLDFLSGIGDPVVASKSGRITFSGEDKGYGYLVEIAHPDGLITRYAHLSKLQVGMGEWVPVGRVIGLSGRSGNANDRRIRPHLHFEIRYSDSALNPGRGLLDPAIKVLNA
ncbi:MAG TPA: M23 family metallopeptidase, partial [Candidatus Omnitrophota bacterium]|nr:M23 family metallopeptidase [Candidatus Omnitrophota bacterium]